MKINKKKLYTLIREEIIAETHSSEVQKAINLMRQALGLLAPISPEAALKLGPLIHDLENEELTSDSEMPTDTGETAETDLEFGDHS